MPRDRLRVIESLARRTDETVVGVLLSFLWHLEEVADPERFVDRDASARLEHEALAAATGLGPACYAGAERFLRAADTAARRRRGVALLRGLRDPRATQPLLEALAWELEEESSYHVAAALEELGDPLAVNGLADAALDVRRPAARRREAAEALAAFRDPRAVGAMGRLAREVEFGLVSSYGLFRLTGDKEALGRLREALVAGSDPPEALRLLAKCDSPVVEGVLVEVLPEVTTDLQPAVVALLEGRFWESARPRVLAIFLKEAGSVEVSEFALAMLGKLGGEPAVDRLLDLLGKLGDYRWELAARALAQTGDDRAVRYFSRMKILDRNEQRRELARQLHELAARRRAELRSAGGE
jgi:HEAT repeat protein